MSLETILELLKGASLGMLGGAVIANQILLTRTVTYMNKYESKIKVPSGEIELHKGLPEKFRVLDYLNLANSLVWGCYVRNCDCKDYSFGTFKIYLALCTLNNRPDLRDRIRLVLDYNAFRSGHVFIEANISGKKIYYEPSSFTPIFSAYEQIPAYSDTTFYDKQRISPSKNTKSRVVGKSFWGKDTFYPTLGLLFYQRRFLRFMGEIKKKKELKSVYPFQDITKKNNNRE